MESSEAFVPDRELSRPLELSAASTRNTTFHLLWIEVNLIHYKWCCMWKYQITNAS